MLCRGRNKPNASTYLMLSYQACTYHALEHCRGRGCDPQLFKLMLMQNSEAFNQYYSSQAHPTAAAPYAVTECTITLLGNIVLPESTLLQPPQPLSFSLFPIFNNHLQPASPFLIRTTGTRPLCPHCVCCRDGPN